MTLNRFKTAIFAGVAGLALVTACGPNPDQNDEATEQSVEPVRLETPPAGQLPDTVTPTSYNLNLITDPAKDGFSGTVEIGLRLSDPHARIWLHSLDQTIERAFVRLEDGR